MKNAWKATLIGFAAALLLVPAIAGDLEPPGPPSSTMRTLEEVEPRVDVATLPGSADAVHVISEPGSYYLTGNIKGQSGKDAIRIECDYVQIDLNGYSVIGVPGSDRGINVILPGEGIIIRNGIVRDFDQDGIYAAGLGEQGTRAVRLHNLVFVNNQRGANVGFGALVTDSVAVKNRGTGFFVDGYGATFIRCVSQENLQDGFWGQGRYLVKDSHIHDNGGNGLFSYRELTIKDSRIAHNGSWGIYARWNSHIVGNTFEYNTTGGIYARERALVAENKIAGGTTGIIIEESTGSVIKDNLFVFQNGTGVQVDSSGNTIRGNDVIGASTPYSIASGNVHGPIVDLSAGGDVSSIPGSEHPWANTWQ